MPAKGGQLFLSGTEGNPLRWQAEWGLDFWDPSLVGPELESPPHTLSAEKDPFSQRI